MNILLISLVFSGVSAELGQLLVGGRDNNGNRLSVQVFPPPSSNTCSIPQLPEPRTGHSISLLSGGRLVVCGGKGDVSRSCIGWQSGNTSWTHLHTLSTARAFNVAWTPSSSPNAIVLFGLRNAEILPGGGTFPLRHSGFRACGIPDGETIVITGGRPSNSQAHNYVTRYAKSGFVEELPQLPENRRDHACAALPSTKAFIVAGGASDDSMVTSVITLLPGAQAWTPLASLPRSLGFAPASIVGGKMRVTGGWDGVRDSPLRSEVLEYQPEPSNKWITVGHLEAGRYYHAVLSIGPELLPCLKGRNQLLQPSRKRDNDNN